MKPPCDHVKISTVRAHDVDVCICECGHAWEVHSGELRFALGIVSARAFALLTPRDERNQAMWSALGDAVIAGAAADGVRQHTSKHLGARP